MELTKEQKRWLWIAGGIIAVLFIVGLMLKFWSHTILTAVGLVVGFIYGRRSKGDKKKEGLF